MAGRRHGGTGACVGGDGPAKWRGGGSRLREAVRVLVGCEKATQRAGLGGAGWWEEEQTGSIFLEGMDDNFVSASVSKKKVTLIRNLSRHATASRPPFRTVAGTFLA